MPRIWSPGIVEYPLTKSWQKAGLMLAAGILALILAGGAVRVAVATKFADSLDLGQLQTAVAIDPENAEFHRRLGVVYLYGLANLDPVEGTRELRRAIDLNPHLFAGWASLGSACDSVGDTACADWAYDRLLSLSPMTPRYYWAAANHYFLTGMRELGFSYLRRLLELNLNYAPQTFALGLRATNDPRSVLAMVLKASQNNPKLSLLFIDFLCAHGNPHFALDAWGQLVSRPLSFPFSWARPYLDDLLELPRFGDAVQVWRDLERLGVVPQPAENAPRDLIYNGGFEHLPLNSGLDWHFKQERFLSLDFQAPECYQGTGCLRAEIAAGGNEEYEPAYQFVPADPGRTYLLTAYINAEDITSDSGPRIRVLDPSCGGCLDISTDPVLGTTRWQAVSLRFKTAPQTQILRVSVWRPRSRTFPAEISGRFWVDSVSLKEAH